MIFDEIVIVVVTIIIASSWLFRIREDKKRFMKSGKLYRDGDNT